MTLPNISGLVAHFDANNITLDHDDLIAQWDDESGNDYHLTQSNNSLKPSFKKNVQNGLPGVYFSSNGHMGTPTWTTISQPFSAFLVHSSISPSNGVSWDVNGSGGRSFIARDRTNGTWRIWNSSDFTNSSSVGITTDILLISTRWSNTSNQGYIRFNKGNEANGTTGNNGIGSIRIAADNGGGRELTGYYCEIILYDRALTTQEIEDVEDYLWEKWFVEKTDVIGPFPTFKRS